VRSWVLLLTAVASEVTATLALKQALDQPLLYVVVALGYVVALVLLSTVLRAGMRLGVAYGAWAALGVTGTALLSAVLYGESLTPLVVIGIVLVVTGVLAVEVGSHHDEPPEVAT
jgi:small multidrug resistance pump